MNVKIVVGSIAVAVMLCSSASAATSQSQQGLSQAQLDQGCVKEGRWVSCPSQMQVVGVAPMTTVEAVGMQRSVLVGKWSGTNGSSVTFRPTNRNVDGWRIPPSDGGRGWSTYGFNANLDTAGKTLDGNILLQGCSTISLVHSASGVHHAMDVNQNTSAGNGAHQTTNSNQKGLSQQQINHGCVIAGEYIECPGQMRRYRHTFEAPQFGRKWQVYVPGAAYTTENRVAGTRTLHTSVGANLPDNTLNIVANGTYWWKADGKLIQGRWVQANDSTLILQKAYKGVDWSATTEKLGADENGKLVLWQGNEQLKGR